MKGQEGGTLARKEKNIDKAMKMIARGEIKDGKTSSLLQDATLHNIL